MQVLLFFPLSTHTRIHTLNVILKGLPLVIKYSLFLCKRSHSMCHSVNHAGYSADYSLPLGKPCTSKVLWNLYEFVTMSTLNIVTSFLIT